MLTNLPRTLTSSWLVFVLGFGAAVGMVAIGTKLAKNDPQVVRSQRFQLVDAQGTLRGEWGFKDEIAQLVIYDTKGVPRVRIGCADDPGIYVLKNDASPAITLAHRKNDGAWMTIKSDDGTGILSARTSNEIGPFFGVFKNGDAGAGMRCLADGVSEIFIQDTEKRPAWRVSSPPKEQGEAK